jgi:hypothetical protein
MMFEIGKRYTVWMDEGDGVGSLDYQVADFQPPLLRLHNPNVGHDMIVNTASPMFVRAQLSKFQDPIGAHDDDFG